MNNSTSQQRELEAAIMYLKDHLSKEWRDVARLLGLTDSEIHITNYDYHGNTKEKTYQMFVKWMRRKGNRATLSAVTHALRGVDRCDLAYALKKGEHLAYVSKIHDVRSSVVKENNKVGNQMMRQAGHQPKRNWLLVIVCIVSPVLVACLIYPVVIRKQMNNNGGSSDMKAAYDFKRDTSDDEVFRASYRSNAKSNNFETTKISEYDLLESDHLENAARYVKNSLTKEWQDVGRYLGLSHPDLEHINEQYNNPKERNYQMLQRWREQYGNKASIEALEDALRKAGRRDLADNLHKEKRKQESR